MCKLDPDCLGYGCISLYIDAASDKCGPVAGNTMQCARIGISRAQTLSRVVGFPVSPAHDWVNVWLI